MKLLLALAVLFIAIPVLEFAVLIEVGRRIGTLDTILLVFGTGMAGAFLAKKEGLRIVNRIQDDLRSGVMPAEQIVNGAIVLAAGLLLLSPGLLTDIAGLLLLFPPTRYPVRLFVLRTIRQRLQTRTIMLH